MANRLVLNRLKGIQTILMEACRGGDGMAPATIGSERESFINLVLSNVIAPPYRVGKGDVTDSHGNQSGQVDVVIEYSTSLSFPLLRGDGSRLYLAEGICAVVEIKSDISKHWKEVVHKARLVQALRRDTGVISEVDPYVPDRVPFFAVGYKGWTNPETVAEQVANQRNSDAPVDGLLVIDPGIYRGRDPLYSDHNFDGPSALYGFLLSIEQLTSSMITAKPAYRPYVVDAD